jgi:hypothetical protein
VTRPSEGTGGGETWNWTGAEWQRQLGGDLGSSYSGALLGYDPTTRSLLAEGCCQVSPSDVISRLPSTWRWDGSRWLDARAHSPGDASAMALDPVRGELVLCNCNLVGGIAPSLYAWSGSTWSSVGAGSVPSQAQAEIDDVSRSQFLLLGFAIAGGDSIAQPLDVWLLSETGWRQLDAGPAAK